MQGPIDELQLFQAVGLFFLTFIFEDVAILSGATLAATGALNYPLAFSACYFGVWVGDLGLFAIARSLGRPVLGNKWVQRYLNRERLERSEAWMHKYRLLALMLSRVVPGSRLPTYFAAGLLSVPASFFAMVTGVSALVWVSLVFFLVLLFAMPTVHWLEHHRYYFSILLVVAVAAVIFKHSYTKLGTFLSSRPRPNWRRWMQWEFWPGWLFYPPVGAIYLFLGFKYRGFNLPMAANPGMLNGGLVGESKYQTLAELYKTSPRFTPQTDLITSGDLAGRLAKFRRLISDRTFTLPVVFKPDVAQRGDGFKLIRSTDAAETYLRTVRGDVVVQEYVPGPLEAGIFYYRFPTQDHGRIFAITDKVFPTICGDGKRTVEQLILDDRRAAIIAPTFLERHSSTLDLVLPEGELLKLVEAGNHSQGCIFREGMHLLTESLTARFDEISKALSGFYIGRYDVRYSAESDLMRGENFKILELNGASSEATSLYDSRYSLLQAYATLYRQWDLIFAIGAANRKLGFSPGTIRSLLREWGNYRQLSVSYPPAD